MSALTRMALAYGAAVTLLILAVAFALDFAHDMNDQWQHPLDPSTSSYVQQPCKAWWQLNVTCEPYVESDAGERAL